MKDRFMVPAISIADVAAAYRRFRTGNGEAEEALAFA